VNKLPSLFEKAVPHALLVVAALLFFGANGVGVALADHPEIADTFGMTPEQLTDVAASVVAAISALFFHGNVKKAEEAPSKPPVLTSVPADARVDVQLRHSLAGLVQLALEDGKVDFADAVTGLIRDHLADAPSIGGTGNGQAMTIKRLQAKIDSLGKEEP